MRSASARSIQMGDGSVGYVHALGDKVVVPVIKENPKKEVNWETLWQFIVGQNKPEWKEGLADELEVTYSSLVDLEVMWWIKYQAWAFPMRNGHGKIVGIQRRFSDGSKRMASGSTSALFIPQSLDRRRLWVFEGASDVCAALGFGLNAIGRPSCKAGLFDIITLCSRIKPKEVVIVADSDTVGLEGAATLSRHLPVKSCTITVPGKDMRSFKQDGGDARMLDAMVDSMVWCLPAGQQSQTSSIPYKASGGH